MASLRRITPTGSLTAGVSGARKAKVHPDKDGRGDRKDGAQASNNEPADARGENGLVYVEELAMAIVLGVAKHILVIADGCVGSHGWSALRKRWMIKVQSRDRDARPPHDSTL
jgi:hypothetical protein